MPTSTKLSSDGRRLREPAKSGVTNVRTSLTSEAARLMAAKGEIGGVLAGVSLGAPTWKSSGGPPSVCTRCSLACDSTRHRVDPVINRVNAITSHNRHRQCEVAGGGGGKARGSPRSKAAFVKLSSVSGMDGIACKSAESTLSTSSDESLGLMSSNSHKGLLHRARKVTVLTSKATATCLCADAAVAKSAHSARGRAGPTCSDQQNLAGPGPRHGPR